MQLFIVVIDVAVDGLMFISSAFYTGKQNGSLKFTCQIVQLLHAQFYLDIYLSKCFDILIAYMFVLYITVNIR